MSTSDTIQLLKAALAKSDDNLAKAISTASNLIAYDLQAPAKNLYPVLTPLRNILPRVAGKGGVATRWRQITALTGSGYDAMPWVPEGQRAGQMNYSAVDKAASYITIGEETQATYEAISAAEGFEDLEATNSLRLLQKMMIKEEHALLGGNTSIALGVTPTPTLTATGSGATLPAATYSVICVALTYEGLKNSSLSGGVSTSQVVTGADGKTFTLSGGSANKSANATQAVTLGQTLTATVAPVQGALGYAWYVGTAGSEKLEAITTVNTVAFSAPLAGIYQAATAITADNSRNTQYACDGLLTFAQNAANGAYYKAFATGAKLTASGKGSVVEIDTMLQALWDLYQVSPTHLFVNSQQLNDITTKCLSSGTYPLLYYRGDSMGNDSSGKGGYSLSANGAIRWYYNPFGNTGQGSAIQIIIHPTLPAGTILAHCAELPMQYQSDQVPNVAEVHTRKDYYQIDWPLVTRARQKGVYAEEVLACYAPFALGVMTNITPG
jgi:hypothetical protein